MKIACRVKGLQPLGQVELREVAGRFVLEA